MAKTWKKPIEIYFKSLKASQLRNKYISLFQSIKLLQVFHKIINNLVKTFIKLS